MILSECMNEFLLRCTLLIRRVRCVQVARARILRRVNYRQTRHQSKSPGRDSLDRMVSDLAKTQVCSPQALRPHQEADRFGTKTRERPDGVNSSPVESTA